MNKEELSSVLECGICADVMVEPYTLGECGHTFCWMCIYQWDQSNRNKKGACCPQCRRYSHLTKNYTKDSILIKLLDVIRDEDYDARVEEYHKDKSNYMNFKKYKLSKEYDYMKLDIDSFLSSHGHFSYSQFAEDFSEMSVNIVLSIEFWKYIIMVDDYVVLKNKTDIKDFLQHHEVSAEKSEYIIKRYLEHKNVEKIELSPIEKKYIHFEDNMRKVYEYVNKTNFGPVDDTESERRF